MNDEELKEFLERMRRYAISRGAPKEEAEEFSAHAWECWFVREWRATKNEVWKDYVRNRLGARGSAKNKVENAIRYRQAEKTYSGSSDRVDYLENFVAAEKKEEALDLKKTSPRMQMIAVLIDAGWSLSEVFSAMGLTNQEALKEKRALQSELSASQQLSAGAQKKLDTRSDFERQHFAAMRLRKKASKAIDVFSLAFPPPRSAKEDHASAASCEDPDE